MFQISEEFYRLKPNAEEMCKTFLMLQPRILALPEKRPISLLFEHGRQTIITSSLSVYFMFLNLYFFCLLDTMRALTLISQHLPHDIPTKEDGSVDHSWGDEEDLFVVKQVCLF